jgi:fructose 1,6-bisphosphate aldolase/phosphatase
MPEATNMKREQFLAKEKERSKTRSTITVVSADLEGWVAGHTSIPESIVQTVKSELEKAKSQGLILDFRVYPFAFDLLIEVTTFGRGLYDMAIHTAILESLRKSLSDFEKSGGTRKDAGKGRVDAISAGELVIGLRLRAADFPFTERQAEPIFIAKIMNGATGAFNRMLFDLFFHPDKGSHQRLDGTRFVALVENVADIREAKEDRRIWVFGDRPEEDLLFLTYPFSREPLECRADQVGDWAEMLSLIANPSEWAVSAIYAVKGRFVMAEGKLSSNRHEPVALVSIEGALPGIYPDNPVAVLRLQSGLPAVGEAHFNLGGDFHFITGGKGGGYHVGLVPVTIAEARSALCDAGTARVAAYTYQSYDNGRIPPDHDVIDVFAQDEDQTEWLQKEASNFIHIMLEHGEFQPYLTAEEAERRAEARAEELKGLFEAVPSYEKGEKDSLIAKANSESGRETLSDIKADGGGKVGHTSSPALFAPVAEASLKDACEQGLIRDFEVLGVGDDLHLIMYHDRGIVAIEIHLLAFRTFWRAVWVTEVIGYKPYSLAQDLQIGPATKGKKIDDLADPGDRFIELLAETLEEPEASFLDKIQSAQSRWKQGHPGHEVRKPFAGNVTGQGPGFAEIPVRAKRRASLLAADKAGPAAFNILLFQAAQTALIDEAFQNRHGKGIGLEIWDIHRHTRIFLDAHYHRDDVARLLGATNLFNVKRVWSLPRRLSERGSVKSAVEDILASASTERLALIAGGQYVGKDDPVLLGDEDFMRHVFEYLQTRFYMTQGDERGSHYMMLVPKPLRHAIATIRSRGLCSGLIFSLSSDRITETCDVFDTPGFHEAALRADRTNARIWRAQGSEFTPVGVGARDVEPAYPLMKVLNRLTAPTSTYALTIKDALQPLYNSMVR